MIRLQTHQLMEITESTVKWTRRWTFQTTLIQTAALCPRIVHQAAVPALLYNQSTM